ncbi:MAG TPA: hypothetical protein VGB94_06920 [Acidobacteriaceae bacterium]
MRKYGWRGRLYMQVPPLRIANCRDASVGMTAVESGDDGEMGGSRGRWCGGSSLAVWVTRGASGFFGFAQNDSIGSGGDGKIGGSVRALREYPSHPVMKLRDKWAPQFITGWNPWDTR